MTLTAATAIVDAVITASGYNLLRSDIITNVSAISLSAVAASLTTHEALASVAHGLGSGVYFAGSKLGEDYLVDAKKSALVTLAAGANGYGSVTWSAAFVAAPVVTYNIESVGAQAPTDDYLTGSTTTGATVYIKNPGGAEKTFYIHFFAVGK